MECSGPNKVVSSPALRAWASGLAPVVYMCNHNNIWKTSRDEGNKVYSSSHLVCKSKEGKSQYVCDDNCPQQLCVKICSYSLAVAETRKQLPTFSKWYVLSGTAPTL